MNGSARVKAWKLWLILPLLWRPDAALPAAAVQDPPSSASATDEEHADELDIAPVDELEEVLVIGAKKVRDPQANADWLKRLVGQYSYDGHVEWWGEGAPRGKEKIRGAGKCIAFARITAVQCAINVVWQETRREDGEELPGGVSTLAPAMILYAIDMDRLGIRSLQVDNRGIADGGLGHLRGNTLTTTTACADLPGDCRRISRIAAQPDGRFIQMQIDIERDAQRTVRFNFDLRRVDQPPGGQKK